MSGTTLQFNHLSCYPVQTYPMLIYSNAALMLLCHCPHLCPAPTAAMAAPIWVVAQAVDSHEWSGGHAYYITTLILHPNKIQYHYYSQSTDDEIRQETSFLFFCQVFISLSVYVPVNIPVCPSFLLTHTYYGKHISRLH